MLLLQNCLKIFMGLDNTTMIYDNRNYCDK